MGSSCTTKQNNIDKHNNNKLNPIKTKNLANLFPKGKYYYNFSDSR